LQPDIEETAMITMNFGSTRARPISDGSIGLPAVIMVESALESARTGKTVNF
jgi:hypothetical protein